MVFATKMYLKERLKLDISPEKSRIINLRKNKSEFLGYLLYVVPKRNKWVCNSRISNKKKKQIKLEIKKRIKAIQLSSTRKNVQLYNAYVLGLRNYFRYVTHVNIEMKQLAFNLSLVIFNRLKVSGNMKFQSMHLRCLQNSLKIIIEHLKYVVFTYFH